MTFARIRFEAARVIAATALLALALTISGAPSIPKCDPDNGGLKLPAGFSRWPPDN